MDEATEVMSLDELMDLAAEPHPAATTRPHVVPAPAPQEAVPSPYPASGAHRPPSQPQQGPTDAVPVDSGGAPMQLLLERMRTDGRRMLDDARRASGSAGTQVQQWLETKDNALIAATVLVTLLLLIVVAAL